MCALRAPAESGQAIEPELLSAEAPTRQRLGDLLRGDDLSRTPGQRAPLLGLPHTRKALCSPHNRQKPCSALGERKPKHRR